MNSINPHNNKIIQSYQCSSDNEIEQIISKSKIASKKWKNIKISKRVEYIDSVSVLLNKYLDEFSLLITTEMGKPILESKAEIEKCILLCNYYKDNAENFLKDEQIFNDKKNSSFLHYEPLGVILGIMPWNFPFWQVFRFAIPTILAGNVVIVKHASNVTGCLLAIDKIFNESSLPDNIFSSIIVNSSSINKIIKNPVIKAVSLTGSEVAGMSVASQTGRLIKKTVLELGGSDPFIVRRDANIEKSIEFAIKSRMLNTGQSCIAAKRFIIHHSIFNDFIKGLHNKVKELVIGNPVVIKTNVGPMAREDLRSELHKYVTKSIDLGAKVICGAKKLYEKGCYYEPTILVEVSSKMPIYHKEIFGPVFTIMKFKSDEEAITLANDTNYGLGASIWSNDVDKAVNMSKKIISGMVTINDMMKSDPCLPFGGTKLSGYGKELSYMGIREFTNIKTITINNYKGVLE